MEEDLIRRARAGDQAAFRSLVERYLPVAWRICRILLADRGMAEDALQEAWIDVWTGLPRVNAARPLRPWLLTVVANRCRMAARRRGIPTIPLDAALVEQLHGVDSIAHELELRDRYQAEVARYAALQTALSMLSREQRQLLALRYQAELELGEIALIIGVPVGTVKSRLHRTLATLRTRLTSSQPAQAKSPSSSEAMP
jgi:RNA polymerase sigma-70 factor (ECF subfamily)